MKSSFAVAVIFVFAISPAALAQKVQRPVLEQLRVNAGTAALRSASLPLLPLTPCYAGSISCSQTRTGRVSVDSCESDGVYGVGYSFTGTQGTRVTISGRSPEFAASIALADGRQGQSAIYAQADVFIDGQTATISNFTLPYTGDYFILITPGVRFEFGDYSVSITCTSGPITNCTPNSTTACMLNGRFRVTVLFRNAFDNNSVDTSAGVKSVTGFSSSSYETAFFYFNNSNNIELMVKILDQGNSNPFGQPTIAVLYGSATPLRVELSITDTLKGGTKKYTSVFGAMQGTTDFTAFVK